MSALGNQRHQINNVRKHLLKVLLKKKNESKNSIKIKAEIDETEKSDKELGRWKHMFIGNINKTGKPLAKLTKRRKAEDPN